MAEQWFARAETQGAKITAMLQKKGAIASVRTYDNYKQALTKVAQSLKDNKLPSINNLTPEIAVQYLTDRAVEVGQSALNMERQAMQSVMRLNQNLSIKQTLPVIKSEHAQVLASRAYTQSQVQFVTEHQTSKNSLATEIAYAAGLRAHELLTLRPINEQRPDSRPTHESKFEGLKGQAYTVTGKGGLCREIRIPDSLVERLEANRLTEPVQVTDRTVNYTQHYEIGAGQKWSNSFSAASNRGCGWSNGAHGMRHSYAQERMNTVQFEHTYKEALLIVSQEMGHFRPEITEIYLR